MALKVLHRVLACLFVSTVINLDWSPRLPSSLFGELVLFVAGGKFVLVLLICR